MRGRASLRERYRRLLGRSLLEEIDEEVAFHLEMRAREAEERGESPARARERALERFGDVAETRAKCEAIARRRERRMARAEYLEELWQDLRFAGRTMTRSPGFTGVALATLVLGIGATTAIFSVVNGVLLRPLPFPEPERVVHLGWDWGSGSAQGYLSAYKVEYFAERAQSFEALSTFNGFSSGLGRGAEEAGVRGLRVSHGFLDVVGHRVALGRWFTPEEDAPGAAGVAVLGHGLWRTRFGGDPGVVGREVVLGGEPRTVIGVLAPGFRFPQAPDYTELLVPYGLDADPQDGGHNYPLIARLAAGVDRERASAELATLSRAFAAEHPELMDGDRERGMGVTGYREIYVGGLGGVLWILLGAVSLVLLIACANVANLLLARTTERRREIAVRSAVGATRGRLIRQILTESLALSVAAGALGLAFAAWGTRALLAAVPAALPRSAEIGVDVQVVLFTLGAAVLTAVVFGLAAALPSSRAGAMAALREAGRGAGSSGRLRSGLLMAEAAVSLVLLVGAGLLVSTLLQLRAVDPGFEADGLLTATLPRWPDRYATSDAAVAGLERELLERLVPPAGDGATGAGPVRAAALASNVPLRRGWNLPMEVEGRPEVREGDVEWRAVSPGYFETVGAPVVRGRAFTAADDASAPRVVIVNEAFVREYFPDSDPLGERIALGRYDGRWIAPEFEGEPARIVGVVADMREMALRRDPKRTMLVPRSQAAMSTLPVILMRTSRPGEAGSRLRQALREIDPSLPPPSLVPMDAVVAESLARERFNALLMGLFAALAVLLTAVGIFGVVSYGVRRRRQEIGIRMALGARASDVTRLVTRQGMAPVVAGLALGVAGALALARLLRSMIWGVSTTDPWTFAAVTALLAGVALLASWIPARRAARGDPVRALRPE